MSAAPSLLERLLDLLTTRSLLPLEEDLVRRTIAALDLDPDTGVTSDEIIEASRRRCFAGGEAIVTEGEVGSKVFVLLDGRATVERGETKVNTLVPGEIFGEIAMLTGSPRSATVRAEGEAVVLCIPAGVLDDDFHERLWEYAGERRFMDVPEAPVGDRGRRNLWWRLARLTTLGPGQYHLGWPWLFVFHGEIELDGEPVPAPALVEGGAVRVADGNARVALLEDPATLPG